MKCHFTSFYKISKLRCLTENGFMGLKFKRDVWIRDINAEVSDVNVLFKAMSPMRSSK